MREQSAGSRMTLRRTTVFSIAAVFLLLVALQFLLADAVIHSEFVKLENERAERNLQRAASALEYHAEQLEMLTADWASWDDSYGFIQQPNQEFIESNLPKGILRDLKLNGIAFLDIDGSIKWSAYLPREAKHWRAFPEEIHRRMVDVLKGSDPVSPKGIHGILKLSRQAMIVACEPILKSDKSGPYAGWLFMGSFLDAKVMDKLSQGVQEDMSLYGPGMEALPDYLAEAAGPPESWSEAPQVLVHGDNVVSYKGLRDLQGKVSLLLAVPSVRKFFNTGVALSRINFFMFALAAFIMGAVMVFVLERKILGRIALIDRKLTRSCEHPEESLDLHLDGADELASMAQTMEHFVDGVREGDRFVERLLDSMLVGVVIISCKDRMVRDVNAYALQLIGLEKNQVVGKECHGFICPNQRGRCPVLDEGVTGEMARRILLTSDGRKLTIFKSVVAIERSGEPLLVETFVDVTEQEQTRLALQESEQKYRTIFMNTGTAGLLLDHDTTIQLANSEFVKLSGVSAEEFEKGDISWTDFFHRDDLARMREFHHLRRKNPDAAPRNYEARFIDARGRMHQVTMTVAMIPGTTMSIASIEDISQRKDAERQLSEMAFSDDLTGLANRQLFMDRLDHAIQSAARRGMHVAVMLCDLDEFKNVNDSFGHTEGDSVLKETARRLESIVRKNDTLARFGGDEFAVLVEDVSDVTNLTRIGQDIIDALSQPFRAGGGDVYLGGSIGIAIYPTDGYSSERLVQNADMAMYRAKEAGKNRFALYTKDLNDRAMRRVVLESELREAIASKAFEVHYQPKVVSDTSDVYGMEALIRWPQPDGSYRPPMKFIPFAESTGMVVPLDLFVMEQACFQNMEWIAKGLGPLKVSANLSPRHFQSGDTVTSVQNVLRRTLMPPEYLELEITETALMTNFDEAKRTLDALSALGVRFSLDDFGTGYSSLAYLRRLPFNVIKIDKSFIDLIMDESEDGRVLVRTMLSMADLMGLETVAEGVETEEQMAFLQEYGCSRVQGYLFSPPLPPESFEQAVREKPWEARRG